MGQDELVLKIPADAEDSSSDPSPKPPSPTKMMGGPSGGVSVRTSVPSNKSHSRESSGASVKFVNSPPHTTHHHHHHPHHLNHHRRTASKGSTESHVVILTPSEDLTASERLSPEEVDDDDDHTDLSEDDRLLPPSPDRVEEDVQPDPLRSHHARMLPPNESQGQGQTYGSFTDLNESEGGAKGGAIKRTGKSTESNADGEEKKPRKTGSNSGDNNDSSVISTDPYSQSTHPTRVQDSCSSDDEAGRTNAHGYTRRKSRHPKNSSVRIEVDGPPPRPPSELGTLSQGQDALEIPAEPLKTLFAFVFLFLAWVATTTSLALTHERVPNIPPLPDVFLDNVQYQSWGLDASEIVIMIATASAFALALFHQHRFIVLRRIFFLAGIHYFYRAVTFYITVLPKADPKYPCAPKLGHITFVEIAQRVLKLLSGMGLSINGSHIYCGDYVYSGHTMTLLMTYLVISEYSPRSWFVLRWISLSTTIAGVVTLLFARGHYSIDVVIAYWITTRLWWIYHTMADNQHVIHAENSSNRLTKFWWWYVFAYLEGNVRRPLPKGYNWPLPSQLQHIPGTIWRKIRGSSAASADLPADSLHPDNDPEAGRPALGQAVVVEGHRAGGASSSASAVSLR